MRQILKYLKEEFFASFKPDFKLLIYLSLPGLFLGLFGLYRVDSFTAGAVIVGGLQKLALEFFFLALSLYILRLAGVKNRWVLAALYFAYLITVTADIALLMYFKERFGAKYLSTLEGGDYHFLKDWRLITYFTCLAVYSIFAAVKLYKPMSRPAALDRGWKAAVLILFFAFVPFFAVLPHPADFYAKHMLPPTPVYTLIQLAKPELEPLFELTPGTGKLAEKYNLFTAQKTPAGLPQFDRIILLTTESLSNKFIHTYNPNVPAEASATLDGLLATYPHIVLKSNALSTLYGLSIIFAGHPNAKMSFENAYPFSFVKILRDNGFETTFIRSAPEDYMDEEKHFKDAGFQQIYGANYFETLPEYKDYISWWGLTDRKLFEFTAGYLKNNKNKKIFLHLLTVDTHVPKGRDDYEGQDYPPAPPGALYQSANMARAFWRHDIDVGLFVENLKKENLLDDKTLLIITGDHPFFCNLGEPGLTKNFKEVFNTLPFIMVSKNKIAAPVTQNPYASQEDIAPTILALTGLPVPRGMFGKNLFDTSAPRTMFNVKEDYIIVQNQNGAVLKPIKKKGLLTLLTNTYLQ
ncbi:MAG: LTA synthase family protein [Elusimicrobia bacterium]|nr:LTA synthase family protein [Elusimicrobiota bacterium]